jgi:hypothetical protein
MIRPFSHMVKVPCYSTHRLYAPGLCYWTWRKSTAHSSAHNGDQKHGQWLVQTCEVCEPSGGDSHAGFSCVQYSKSQKILTECRNNQ